MKDVKFIILCILTAITVASCFALLPNAIDHSLGVTNEQAQSLHRD